jgi:hypothetical protein
MSKELHCLTQEKEGGTVGTNIHFYLTHTEISCIPKDWSVTFAQIVIDHRPQKDDSNWVWITVGGYLIDYPYELTTSATNMVSAKTMWNSVISTSGAKYGGIDIKNMYIKTLFDQNEYMQTPLKFFSRQHYWPLQSVGESPKWLCIHGDLTWHVEFTTSRHLGKQAAVPGRHYVGRTGCHIYGWSARWSRTHLGYTRKVKHQTGIFQITTLVHLQGTIHWSMYESFATTGHSLLTHGISPTILFWRCQPSGIDDNQEHPSGANLKKILLHLKNLS